MIKIFKVSKDDHDLYTCDCNKEQISVRINIDGYPDIFLCRGCLNSLAIKTLSAAQQIEFNDNRDFITGEEEVMEMTAEEIINKLDEVLREKNKTIEALLDAVRVRDELIAAYEEGIKIRDASIRLRDQVIEQLRKEVEDEQ